MTGSPTVKKGRHRRYEEARALKRGPDLDIEALFTDLEGEPATVAAVAAVAAVVEDVVSDDIETDLDAEIDVAEYLSAPYEDDAED